MNQCFLEKAKIITKIEYLKVHQVLINGIKMDKNLTPIPKTMISMTVMMMIPNLKRNHLEIMILHMMMSRPRLMIKMMKIKSLIKRLKNRSNQMHLLAILMFEDQVKTDPLRTPVNSLGHNIRYNLQTLEKHIKIKRLQVMQKAKMYDKILLNFHFEEELGTENQSIERVIYMVKRLLLKLKKTRKTLLPLIIMKKCRKRQILVLVRIYRIL